MLLTTSEIARILRVTPRRVRQIAASRGVEPIQEYAGIFLWDRRQLRRLERRPPGRPRKEG